MSQEVPDPFEAARVSTALCVDLRPDDVLLARPDLSIAAAEKLLLDNASVIAAAMIVAGIDAATRLLQRPPTDA